MTEDNELMFKIITIGDSGVGKTSLIKRFVYDTFSYESTISTLGLNFAFKDVTLNNNKTIKLKFIDTAGQERFKALSSSYFRNADTALFVFSLDDNGSFNRIYSWIESFEYNYNIRNKIPIFLIGNKNDLDQKVEQTDIDVLSKARGIKYIPTSCLNNNNIEYLLKEIAEALYKNFKPEKEQKMIKLKNEKKVKKSKCKCASKSDK